MSPIIPQNSGLGRTHPAEALAQAQLDDQSGWDWFRNEFAPALVADTFRPSDELLIEIADIAATGFGERFFKWLHELTDRAPYPAIAGGAGFEQAALAAAKHQARAAIGQTIDKAIAEGRRLQTTKGK